jgi:hypothetical protein
VSAYHLVALRDGKGQYGARVRAADCGLRFNRGAGGLFDTELLPALVAAVEGCLGGRLTTKDGSDDL